MMTEEKTKISVDTAAAAKRITKKKIRSPRSSNNYLKTADDVFITNQYGFLNNFLYPETIAIEIEPAEVRLLRIRKIKQKYQIERWLEVEFNRNGSDRTAKMLQTIKDALDSRDIKRKKILLIINGPEVSIKTFSVPNLKGNELREAVFWKSRNEISNISDAVVWDFEVIGERLTEKGSELVVQTIIAPERFVNKYLYLLKEIGIDPYRVIVKPFALSSAFHTLTNSYAVKKKNTVVIDIGRDLTLLCFFRNGILEFERTLLLGSSKIDRMLTKPIEIKEKKVSLKQVMIEKYKRRYGILNDFLKGNDKNHFPFNRLFEHILPTLRLFVSEINRSLTFYKIKYQIDKIDAIFLTGKGCNLKNLDLFISEKLKIPVYLIAPFFSSVTWGKFITGFEYTSCFGALVQENKQSNFIPKALKVEKLYKKRIKLLFLVSLLFLFMIGTYSIHLNREKIRYENTISSLYTEYEDLFLSEKKYEELRKQKKELDNKINNVHNTLSKDTKIEDILKIISNATHDNIVLSSIEYNNGEHDAGKKNDDVIIIRGSVYKNFLSADITVLRFISALESYQYFKNVKLVEEKKQVKEKIFLFKIQLEL